MGHSQSKGLSKTQPTQIEEAQTASRPERTSTDVAKRKSDPPPKFECQDQLCETCRGTLASLPFRVGTGGIERDVAEIKESADAGCHACAIFHANISLLDDFASVFGTKARIYLTMSELLSAPIFLVPMSITPLRYVLRPAKDVEHLIQPVAIDSSTGSELSINCAREWLRVCSETHTSCRQERERGPSHGYVPTRLLHVAVRNNPDTIRLCEKGDIPKGTVYATLSHCWGLVLQHKLLTTNIDELTQRGIALSTLAKTFREAVGVVRTLGIDYIWIDCFCIMQDSADDWTREAVLMQHVYGNTHVNIAATDSSDGRGGCFRSRNPQIIAPVKMDYGEPNGELYLTDVSLWWERFEKAPLNRRAWVLQERLLSPRVLHFDSDQLVWECNELTACERFPHGVGELVPPRLSLRGTALETVLRSAAATGLRGQEMVDIWKPVVRAYSACKLTKNSDRLIALYGVAMKIKDLLGCEYSAGLFGRDMESQLLWEVDDIKTSSRPETHVAPSWSWASIVGPVSVLPQWDQTTNEEFTRRLKPEQLNERVLCEVLNKAALGTTPEATPSTSHEALQVRGYLCPVFFVTQSEAAAWKGAAREFRAEDEPERRAKDPWIPDPLPDDNGDMWPLRVSGTGWSRDSGSRVSYSRFYGDPRTKAVVSSIRGNKDASFQVELRYDVVAEHRTKEQRWLLPVYAVTEWEAVDIFDMDMYRSVNGLVLKMDGGESGQFKRCGTFKIGSAQGFEDQWAFWKGCQRFDVKGGVKMAKFDKVFVPDKEAKTGRIFFQEKNRRRQYTVSVV
ncbi:heterokaryon incompatibility protein-domain-containing protein [Lasiosphaeria ovina]|uniref:Heterokaryon incompatibility protein-domain-containing protein n=1 Tax=Lasiosphaeria ovina TaxID=92902 RepID=A0AAE0K3Y8_9PEZI|nr:heterokaryon incompatibility protein-domain-containing protein [Lasiosphaeria ovina]